VRERKDERRLAQAVTRIQIEPAAADKLAEAVREALGDVRTLLELDWAPEGIAACHAQQDAPIAVLERKRRHREIVRCDQWGFPFRHADC
jgi:hypothetical protein